MSASLRKVKNRSYHPATLKRIMKDEGKKARLIFLVAGILLVFSSFMLKNQTVKKDEAQSKDNTVNISNNPITIDKAFLSQVSKKEKEKEPPVKITIPVLSIDLPVKKAKIVNGYWELFDDAAGWGEGSAYPDEAGNQVVFAHAREGLFLPLKKIKKGQKIVIYTKDKWYEYNVEEIKEVLPNQVEVIAPTADEQLTLFTCSGFSDNKRLIIVAKRVS